MRPTTASPSGLWRVILTSWVTLSSHPMVSLPCLALGTAPSACGIWQREFVRLWCSVLYRITEICQIRCVVMMNHAVCVIVTIKRLFLNLCMQSGSERYRFCNRIWTCLWICQYLSHSVALRPAASSDTPRMFWAWLSLPTTVRSCLDPETRPSSCGTPWESASTPSR